MNGWRVEQKVGSEFPRWSHKRIPSELSCPNFFFPAFLIFLPDLSHPLGQLGQFLQGILVVRIQL